MIKLMDSLLRDGILAAQQVWMGSKEWDKNKWYESLRKKKVPKVLLFDLSSFKDWQHFEAKSHTYYPQQERGLEIWQKFFRKSKLGSPEIINHPQFKELKEQRELNEQGFPMVSSEWGFALHYRVAPRFINRRQFVVAQDALTLFFFRLFLYSSLREQANDRCA